MLLITEKILYVFQLSDIYNLKEIKFQIKTAETTADGFWDFFLF